MNIVHLNTFDSGGAGKAAYRLNQALNLEGVTSHLFVKWKSLQDDQVVQLQSVEIQNILFDELSVKYFIRNIKQGNTINSLMYPSVGFDYIKSLGEFDVVNLHWISSFISLEAIVELSRKNIPLVWTLHDQNPFTGACHYSHGCDKYKTDCNLCPQLVSNPYNITKHILDAKVKYIPENITIVAPSRWMAQCAKESATFKSHRIEVIPNSIDTNIFKPYDKAVQKKDLGLPESAKIILFGAEDLNENRKGFSYLLDAIQYLKTNSEIQQMIENGNLHLFTFGNSSSLLDELNVPYTALGYLKDEIKIAQIYSTADVLALPSIEDNLPNIMLESLSCGTPVVAFETGGMKDVVVNGYNGFLCEAGNAKAFADCLAKILLDHHSLGENCRKYAEEHFSYHIQGSRYKHLYEELVSQRGEMNKRTIVPVPPRMFHEVSGPLMDWVIDVSHDIQQRFYHLENEKNVFERKFESSQAELDAAISELQIVKHEKEAAISELQIVKHEKEAAISELQIVKHEKEAAISEVQNLQQKNDTIINEKQKLIHDILGLKEKLETLNIEIVKKNEELEGAAAAIKALQEEITQLLSSTSWKITKPLRYIGKIIKNLKR